MKRCLWVFTGVFLPMWLQAQQIFWGTDGFIRALKQATDVMVNDVTSPVAAGRYYAYINLAAYQTSRCFQRKSTPVFESILNGYNGTVLPVAQYKQANEGYAVLHSVLKISELLLPSGYLLKAAQDSLQQVASSRSMKLGAIQSSQALAEAVVAQVLAYARQDGFAQLSGREKYTPLDGYAWWRPTPPGYMAAIEPNWDKLRTFLLPSADAVAVIPPATFDTAQQSSFYKQMRQVYQTGKHLSRSQKDIADFWDCNPFALQQIGHVEFGLKKISPGGHWIGITGIACRLRKLPLYRTVIIHAAVSITMADAFISCWHQKYKTNRVRPETAIQKWIDPFWKPFLQTPPFPEYTSGHSVVSASVAEVLTHYFGVYFSFIDDTEVEFGLPTRRFTSFRKAAAEAAISRFYGGIHFMDAITNGSIQGREIGKLVIDRLK